MLERFSKVSDLNIIVIGDIILDEYITGSITRMSAEAPIPIVDKSDTHYILGGSANVAANLLSLGANPILIGTIGDDTFGKTTKELLSQNDISNSILVLSKKPTTVKSRVMVDGKQIFRIDSEDSSAISEETKTAILSLINKVISNQTIDAIILQDYNKGIFTPSMIQATINLAAENNIKTFVDPKFDNYWLYKSVDYFKPNKNELFHAIDGETITIEEAISKTKTRLNCKHVICTLAEQGIAIQSESGYLLTPTKSIDLVDVSGAGDSTLSMIAISAILGYSHEEILQLSNAAGRSACQKLGVSTISLQDIEKNL